MQSIIVSLLVIFSKFWAVEEEYPKPNFYAIATVNSVYDGAIDTATLFKQKKLLIYSDKKLKINGFTIMFQIKGYEVILTSNSEYFTQGQIDSLRKYTINKGFLIHNIIAEFQNKKYYLNPVLLHSSIAKQKNLNVNKSIQYGTFLQKADVSIQRSEIPLNSIDSVPNYKIISYKIYPWFAVKCIYEEEQTYYGRAFSNKALGLLSKLNKNSLIILHDIKAITPNKDTVLLTPISISIR